MKIYIIVKDYNKINKLGHLKKNLFNKIKNDYNIIITDKIIYDTNSIYLIIKNYSILVKNIIDELKKLNNKIIFQPIDFDIDFHRCKKRINKLIHIFNVDMLIFNSNYHQKRYKKQLRKSSAPENLKYTYIFHEYDERIKPTHKVNEIYYIGNLNKTSLKKDDFDMYNIKILQIGKRVIDYTYTSIHIDFVLENHPYYLFHTSTKLATALITNSIFICNRIPIYVELLGNNYEYYLEDDKSNFNLIINKAFNTFNNDNLYEKYLKSIKNVKLLLSHKEILNKYIDIFNTI